ncbi:MAG: tetratricopeptide repeat protein [Candidatus Marinimicrobia bacterium]|nr:tetratricopeptide repeat protein [Candidatus Neomarinimicrobiota bacterium]
MAGLKWIFIVSSFLFSTPVEYGDSPAENLDTYYESGLDHYQSRAYQNAKSAFEKVLENNWESPELYYNLGNVYYRLNDISGAVWAYEMCLHHDPTHEDAMFNLKLVNVNVKDRIAIPEAPIYLKLYMGIKERFTPNEWVKITLGLFVLFLIFVLIRKFWGYLPVLNISENFLLVLISITFLFSLHSIWSDSNISQGIIYIESVAVLSEPNVQSTTLFQVHEGLKVSITQNSKSWVEIELVDGKSGWISGDKIRAIH